MSPSAFNAADDRPSAARAAAALILLGVVLALTVLWAIRGGRPVALPESPGASLPCISYAPFRRAGQTPFDPALHITPAAIEDDLRRLASVTGCVRTYGLDHGLDAVPAVARRLGLRIVLGAWIGRDEAANAAQLRRALQLAHQYRDVIQLLVVGNEVLLRRELPPAALAALLAQARRESPVPVAYADVWEFWLRHAPLLQPHVDVAALHILPYWEDQPVGSDRAVDHVYAVAAQLRLALADTPVWVAETGWPAAGRQRGAAVPGRLEQARFVRELLARQQFAPLPFNLVEGFDQPWKRALEGAMGGAWGMFDADGELRVALSGPVAPDPRWFWLPAAAWFGAAGCGCAWYVRRPRRGAGIGSMTAAALAGALIGAFGLLQALALPLWSRSGWEWAAGCAALGVSMLAGLAAAWRLAQLLQGGAECPRGGLANALMRRDAAGTRPLALALGALLFLAAVEALGLVFDARYRPLPWPAIAAPALLLAALAGLGDRLPAAAREERLLAAVCAVCAALVAILEGVANTQAMLYAGLLLTLALASLWPHRAPPLAAGGSSASAASSTAGAAQSVE